MSGQLEQKAAAGPIVILVHVLRNSMMPVITAVALNLPHLFLEAQ